MVDVDALLKENAALRSQIAQLLGTQTMLVEQVGKLTERVSEVLAVAQRKGRKPPVEKAPAPPPQVDDDAQRAFNARPVAPMKSADEELEKPRAAPTGRKPLPSH